MAENLSMALAELLRKADAEPDVVTLREGVRVIRPSSWWMKAMGGRGCT